MPTLRPQLQAIANRQSRLAAIAHERLDSLSESQLMWTPSPKRWSIAQIADHLVRVHCESNRAFMNTLVDAPSAGSERSTEIHYSFFDKTFVRFLSPASKIKLPVPKIFAPSVRAGHGQDAIRRLHEEFEAFALTVETADGKQLKGLKVVSPANSLVSPSIVAYIDATVQHNLYHWHQVEALMKDPKFPRD